MSAWLGRIAAVLGSAAMLGALVTACQPQALAPTPQQIESMGLRARHAGQAEALTQLQQWARAGQTVAQRELALALAETPANWPTARDWLERAARGGDDDAAQRLGELHRLGRWGLKPDPAQAARWLGLAARQGQADAALQLALLLKHGDGVARDEAQALHWLQAAADAGNPRAMFLLSQAHARGDGVARSEPLARQWLEAAADRHDPPALQAYALALENGDLGYKKNPALARELLIEAGSERHNRWAGH